MPRVNRVLSVDASEKETIKLCNDCRGTGKVFSNEFGSGASDKVNCSVCDSTGRVKLIRAECELVVPFNYKLEK